jgi:hypothetical protein
MATGFNPSDLTGGYAVSGTGNSVVTTSTNGAVRSVTSHSSGKWYAEFTVSGVSDASLDVGFASGSWTLGRPGFGAPSNSIGITPMSGSESIWANNSNVAFNTPAGPMGLNGTIAVAADLDNGKYYFITPQYVVAYGVNGWNGQTTADPASNIGGLAYALTGGAYLAVGNIGSAGVVVTLNTGQSAFVRGPPSGFLAWDVWSLTWAGQGFFSGAGNLSANGASRLLARGTAAGAGSLTGGAVNKAAGSASLASSGTLLHNYGSAALVSALSVTSADSVSASLAAQTAVLVGAAATSTDSGQAVLSTPSILAADKKFQNALIDSLLRGQPLAAPATWYVALVTTLGNANAAGTEVSGSGYARASVSSSFSTWSGTQGGGSVLASSGTSGMVSNNGDIFFPAPTGDWGTVLGYELWDQPSGGNRWLSGKLSSSVSILNGSGARRFAAGALTISMA